MADTQTPENSGGSGRTMPVGRPFVPGVSPNPGGRPKSFANLIRERTEDGKKLVEFALAVVDGNASVLGDGREPTIKEQLQAVEWLSDRGWGKATQPLEHAGADGGALTVVIHKEGQ